MAFSKCNVVLLYFPTSRARRAWAGKEECFCPHVGWLETNASGFPSLTPAITLGSWFWTWKPAHSLCPRWEETAAVLGGGLNTDNMPLLPGCFQEFGFCSPMLSWRVMACHGVSWPVLVCIFLGLACLGYSWLFEPVSSVIFSHCIF